MKISIEQLSFSYPAESGKNQGSKQVLKDISFSFSDQQPTVLLAPSGSGKTTLLRLLLGFLKPDSGKIEGLTSDTRISVVFQEDRLFDTMNVYENWRIAAPALGKDEAASLCRDLGLSPAVLTQKPATLSGGMRRRAAVGRALLFDAPVILMDEPFQGLDDKTRDIVIRTVKERCRQKALLLITHDPEDAEKLGAKVEKL